MLCVCTEVAENCGDGLPPVSQGCREIGMCDHNWGGWNVTTNATCNTTGVETRKCSICNKSETKTIPKLSGSVCSGGNNGLVLPVGQAWIVIDDEDEERGLIFRDNGILLFIWNNSGYWVVNWEDTYTVSGPKIIANNTGEINYSISGNSLFISGIDYGHGEEFTREYKLTNNINPLSTGGNLVLSAGQAWTNSYSSGDSYGIIFRNDGTFWGIYKYSGNLYWETSEVGTYTVSGNKLTLNGDYYGERQTVYTVFGNLLFVFDDPPSTVTNNINLTSTVGCTQWSGWSVTTAATCNAAGVETRTCQTGATSSETRQIAQLTGAVCNGDGLPTPVIVLPMYKFGSMYGNIQSTDTVFTEFGSFREPYGLTPTTPVAVGIIAYYMSDGMQFDVSTKVTANYSSFSSSYSGSKQIIYTIDAQPGVHNSATISRNIFVTENYCDNTSAPISSLSHFSFMINSGTALDVSASNFGWNVATSDDGPIAHRLVDYGGLNPENPLPGAYTLKLVAVGWCGTPTPPLTMTVTVSTQ